MTPGTDEPNQAKPLPQGWRWVSLGEVCEKPQYGYTASAVSEDVGPKFLRITDIQNGMVDWDRLPHCRCGEEVATYSLKPGDILFARTGGTTGKSYLVQKVPSETVFASYLIRVRTENDLMPDYLYQFLQSASYWSQIGISKRGGAQPNVNATQLSSVALPLPPLPEQKRIAAKVQELMADVQCARTACETQLEAAQALPAAYLRDVFESDEAKKWERRRLGEVCDFSQYGLTATATSDSGGFPYLRITDIDDSGNIRADDIKFVSCDENIYKNYALEEGDILFARSGSIGRTLLYTGIPPKAIFASYLIRFRLKQGIIEPSYLFYFAHSPAYYSFIEQKKHIVSQPNINAKEYAELLVPLPSLPDQKRIAIELRNKIASAEKLKLAIQKELETIEALPQATLRKAFRGEL